MNKSTTLVFTVFNEEESIQNLLKSISKQTKLPNEIIIVDGGSRDKTVKIIKSFFKKWKKLDYKLFIEPGANISRGRNIAISKSKNKYIAVTDGGCKLDKYWLEKITGPFSNTNPPDVVAGYFNVNAKNYFERCTGALLVPKSSRINREKFLPSSRSISFTKHIWKKVGGYPEHLYNAEDTLFDKRLFEKGARMIFRPDALAYWSPRSSIKKFIKQFYNYRKYDIKSGVFKRTYIRSIFSTFLMLSGFFYSLLWVPFIFVFSTSILLVILRLKKNELKLIFGLIPLRLLQEISESTGIIIGLILRIIYAK